MTYSSNYQRLHLQVESNIRILADGQVPVTSYAPFSLASLNLVPKPERILPE